MHRIEAHINHLNAGLAEIKKILERGEYQAAGLTIAVTVGPPDADSHPAVFEVTHHTAEILGLISQSLSLSRACRIKAAQDEFRDLDALLARLIKEGLIE